MSGGAVIGGVGIEARVFTSPRRGEVGAQRRVRGPRPLRKPLLPLTRSASPRDLSPPGRGEERSPSLGSSHVVSEHRRLKHRRGANRLRVTRGAGRRGPCNPGGVSPSLHLARQSVTGPLFTGAAPRTCAGSRFGFLEPKPAQVLAPPSSGAVQSQDETKASRPALLIPSNDKRRRPPLPGGERSTRREPRRVRGPRPFRKTVDPLTRPCGPTSPHRGEVKTCARRHARSPAPQAARGRIRATHMEPRP